MLNDFIVYINKFMNPAELVFAFFGLIFIIVLWIAGGIYEKEEKQEKIKEIKKEE